MRWLSLFAGCGGLDLGLERSARHTVVAAVENNAAAARVYRRRFPPDEQPLYEQDVRTVHAKDLPRAIHAVAAGFPCQPFSMAGARLGTADPRGSLFHEVLRLLDELRRPPYLLLENVPGLLSIQGGRTFGQILAALDKHGYDCVWQVVDGNRFLPQHRERLFIVGSLRGYPRPQVLPLAPPPGWNPAPRRSAQRRRARLGAPRHNPSARTIDANYQKTGTTRTLVTVVKSPYGPYRVRSTAGSAPTLKRATGGNTVGGLFAVELNEKRGNTSPFREGGQTTPTIRSRAANVGVLSDGRPVRCLTPLEAERLQGFPDGWTEGESDRQRYHMIGEAVMVPVAEMLARGFPRRPRPIP